VPVDGHIMTAKSMSRMFLLAVATCGPALVLAFHQYRNSSAVDTQAPIAAPPVSSTAWARRDQGPADLAGTQAKAQPLVAALDGSTLPPESGDDLPAFDIARIEPSGEAVIGGRAAPGATVELLRDNEPYDHAVADQSGEFVMVTPRLPSGAYDLTLRSRQADGKQATSKERVPVSIEPTPYDRPVQALVTPGDPPLVQSQPALITAPVVSIRTETVSTSPNLAAIQPPLAAVAATVDGGLPSSVIVPKIATTTVSRGDSLWRLSRLTYGAGTRYAVIYKANRDQIRNPNLIHPDQIFVLPGR
jgi:nucleoid-associated protein YgaU